MPTLEQARAALAERPFPDNPYVRVTDEAVLIHAGYNEAMQRMLRWVPQARWRAELRAWWVPLTGAELVRAVLPELSRLAEAMQEEAGTRRALRAGGHGPAPLGPTRASAAALPPTEAATGPAAPPAATPDPRTRFRDAARLLYGSDWLRETAQALARDEAALARWLVGEAVAEAPPAQLLAELQALMRSRAAQILAGAARLDAPDPTPPHPAA